MIAKIIVSPDYDLAAIASAAGQTDSSSRKYVGGTLEVLGVEQEALDSALASYDHNATLLARDEAKAQKKKEKGIHKMFDQLLIELNLPQDALARILDKGK